MDNAIGAYQNALSKIPPVQTEAMGEESTMAKAYNNLALALKQSNRAAEAKEAYLAAIELGTNTLASPDPG